MTAMYLFRVGYRETNLLEMYNEAMTCLKGNKNMCCRHLIKYMYFFLIKSI